ncbi:MAG: hypothetical protein HYS51_01595 [Candidatus Zambryskibacteria bacterium]|nr:hypothetical protein [Candidatus Zambryskibacteria bacterium]
MKEQPTTDNRQPTIYFRFIFLLLVVSCLLFVSKVHAQSVDILWQGETYTPPFYQGKSLWSTQSMITFVAIPNGLGNSSSLDFRWTRNGTVIGNSSGRGKNTFSYLDSVISKLQKIEVEVLSGENVLAKSSVEAKPIKPALSVYENSPLYGFMFHKEISGNFKLKEKEVTFTAFPFFFNTNTRANADIIYEWVTNTGETEEKNSVTYRVPENAFGSSQISLHAANKTSITQDVNRGFLVEFGQQ